jgi:tetratricopeptide (TPR) repeat protein
MHLGLLDRAAAEATAAMDINPANLAEPLRVQGAAAMYAGKSSAAVPLLERASAESNAPAEWNLAYAYHNAGRKDEAEAMLRRIRGSSARSQRRAQATLASFLAADGRTTEAAELIDVVIAGSYMDHHVAYSLGAACAQLGRPARSDEVASGSTDVRLSVLPVVRARSVAVPVEADRHVPELPRRVQPVVGDEEGAACDRSLMPARPRHESAISTATWEQLGNRCAERPSEDGAPGPTREQDESIIQHSRPSLQNLPRFKSGRRLQNP